MTMSTKKVDHDEKEGNFGVNEDVEEEEEVGIVPPDGGWGWMVVFSSFMIHIIADGIVYSFGIFFVEFIEYFKAGRAETAWVASILVGLTLGSGPIASVVTNRYGCRPCTMAGGVVASLGLILGVFSPSLAILYLTFGLLAGLGFGLIYLPAIVSVGFYFEKRRAIATGIAVSGSGIGTFIFAPFVNFLVEEYTWKGATLILAGLTLNGVVCGALFRPLPGEIKTKKKKQKTIAKSEVEERLLRHPNVQGEKLGALDITADAGPITDSKSAPFIQESGLGDGTDKNSQYQKNLQATPMLPLDGVKPGMKLDRRLASADHVPTHKSSEPQVIYYELAAERKLSEQQQKKERFPSSATLKDGSNPMNRKDIFYSGSLLNIPMYRSNPDMYHRSVSVSKETSPVKLPPKERRSGFCSAANMETCTKMMDFSLLRDPVFLLFTFSNLFTSLGFNAPFIYIPDRAEVELHLLKSEGAMLLSIVGISNTVGRIVFGFTSDHPLIRRRRLFIYSGSLTICGAATMLSVFATTYYTMMIYSAFFGLFIGAYVTLTSVLLVDLLGLDKLTNSFGILLMFQGIATFGGPPLAGALYDATKSYTIPFLVVGASLSFSGIMLFPVPLLQRYLSRRRGIAEIDVQLGKKSYGDELPSVVSNTETVM